MNEIYDVIVIGAGPAGLTAGLYCAQAGLDSLALEKETLGGQIMNIEKIENYMGFPEGVPGPELGQAMTVQAMNYGVELKIGEAREVRIGADKKIVITDAEEYLGRTVIVAGGGKPMRLGVRGEEEYLGHGVFYCAMCEGGQFRDKRVAVVGGGDAGVTEALYMSRIASKVYIIEVLPQLKANALLKKRVLERSNIEVFCGTRIREIIGDDGIRTITLLGTGVKEKAEMEVDGVLVHIGWEPQTRYLEGVIPLDRDGYVLVNQQMESEVPGVFAVGDVRHRSLRQIAAAVGDGATAAISVQKYLREVLVDNANTQG